MSVLPPGLSRGDHSVIYTGRQIPDLLPNEILTVSGERQLGLPVRVRQFNRTEKLFPTARILWTRVYDVKLDVKPKAFGRISSRCKYVLETQFNQLNAGSSVDARCPRSSGLMAIDGKDQRKVSHDAENSHRISRTRDQSHATEDQESSEDGVSSSGSSQLLGDDSEKQVRPSHFVGSQS